MASADLEQRLRELLEKDRHDQRAFDLLYAACAEGVKRFIAAAVPRPEQAEDLSQEVWLAVHNALPDYQFKSSPRTWVLSIATHKIGDFRRRVSRQVGPTEDLVLETLVNHFGPARRTGESEVDAGRKVERLRKVLAELPDDERQLLQDRFVLGLSPAEIVEERAIDALPNTLSQRLVRLSRKVREALTEPR